MILEETVKEIESVAVINNCRQLLKLIKYTGVKNAAVSEIMSEDVTIVHSQFRILTI